MNRFPLWKNLLVVVVLLAATLVSLPNLFGDEPAVQVSLANGQPLEVPGFPPLSPRPSFPFAFPPTPPTSIWTLTVLDRQP